MASNISSDGCWSVKITHLPSSITVGQLTQTFNLPASRIAIPKVQKYATYFAWVNNFDNEKDARDFADQWSGSSAFGTTIKCDALRSKSADPPHGQHAPLNLPKPAFQTRPNKTPADKQFESFTNKGFNEKSSNEQQPFNQRPKPNPASQQSQGPTTSVVRKSVPKQNVDDKRPLCRYANKGTCREKSNECQCRHQRCDHFEACYKSNCKLAHAKKETVTDSPPSSPDNNPILPDSKRHNPKRSESCSSTSSVPSMSSTQSRNVTKARTCRNDTKCFNVDCPFEHPNGWNPCPDGVKCEDYECTANHPFKRKTKCRERDRCKSSNCKYLHPNTRPDECSQRSKCREWNCSKIHPHFRPRPCSDKANCTDQTCLCLHPPDRDKLLCVTGAQCLDLSCELNHPSERPPKCDQPDSCPNFNCTRLHGSNWDPCEAGDDCEDKNCSKIHSTERNSNLQRKIAAAATPINKNNYQKTKKKTLKSLEQRMKEWEKAQLPILSCRSEFCHRLADEHMLVVTAETGSGKSTQLPQYAAEHFGLLVVCTQPRVVAALSLATRVAEEYDGTSVGESVGYQVGNANRVAGSSIMFMTDAALIRESQRDPNLKHIRVLIIDEAHERSLNTDIVLGIAKILLAQRPNDFYVVVASATIDPTRFLHFFDRSASTPLQVKGRVFPVTTTEKLPPSDCSDQRLIENHVVSSVVELYPRHEGHTLVFLPGQGEIERALRIFNAKRPENCTPLPLYGSQSVEDQEKVIKFNEKDKRMVVFCTNVAETSLTIPNVQLVIDSGWAKEARYDVKRRLTVIETVHISRSSADQRKGRAGRTVAGHCVRLFSYDGLKRQNIEPEILRSSLDLVLLQLVRLKLDPKTFPFMDQPENDIINNSMHLLTQLKCIEGQQITKKGELFTELGLDPRLSAFITAIYSEYQSLLEMVVGIVAILSAPGTIFFMGGGTREAKEEAQAGVALQAQNYESDLIHLYLVYDAWKNAGSNQTQGNCAQCKKQIKWCICRRKYSAEHSLNNKILQVVDTSCTSIIKQIRNARWLQPGNEMPQNSTAIISIQLAQLFPEQCGYLLVPQLPSEGVRLVSTDIRAVISNTSVFMQKLHTDSNRELYQHFVAMTITQLSTGNYIVERLHPIPRSQAIVQSPMQRLMVIENISSEVSHQMRLKLNTHQSESWAKWVVYQYDRPHCRFMIWGLDSDQSTIIPLVQRTQNETLKKLSDAYELLECGPIKANFQSGLICTHINKMTNALRLDLQNVPKLVTPNEVKDWLKKIIDIEWNEIKEHGFYAIKGETDKKNNNDQNKNLYLVFNNEDMFRRAKNKVPPYYLCESDNGFGVRRDSEKENWGRELAIQTPANITKQDIIDRYGADIITKCSQINKKDEKVRVVSSLKLNSLPPTSDETLLRETLQKANGPTPTQVYVGRTKNDTTGWAKITFRDEEERNKAAAIYILKLCQTSFPIMITGDQGPKQKFIQTKVEQDDDNAAKTQSHPPPKNLFLLTIISREATLRIFSSQTMTTTNVEAAASSFDTASTSEWTIDSSATVTVLRSDLYPDFQEIVDRICEKFTVKIKAKDLPNFGKRYIFSHGSPQKTSLAATMLAQNFAPMNIKLTTDRQKQLFNELEEVGEIQKWAIELCLAVSKNKFNTNIEIRGPQIKQGQLMRRITDYSDSFDKRFREHELNATVAAFFGRKKAASSKLQQIASQWSSKSCLVSFIPKTSTIIIKGKPNVLQKDLNDCENEVIQLLDEVTATTNDEESDEEEQDDKNEDVEENDVADIKAIRQERRCVFCQQKSSISTSLFRVCGHAYCRCAAQALSTCPSFPLRCKNCQSDIHIRDIQIIFNNDGQLLTQLLKSSIQNYLRTNAQQDDRVFCPNDECDGLIKQNLGYQTCLTCGQNVCPNCRILEDEFHAGRTCAQLAEEKKRREFLPQLFAAAKTFVDDNWPLDTQMRPAARIDINPYLEKEHKSLKRFYQGIKTLGHPFPPDLAKGFFAYHGCAYQAIGPICQNGFDPGRRSGQAYGRGEYFGVTAAVSHGYAQKGGAQAGFSQMIIAFLLRGPQTTTHGSFCHVVDNPTDWKHAFNLPVLVVTYGQTSASQPSPFPTTISKCIDDDESPWKAPFRWHWRQDNGQFEPYNDAINGILEKFYEQWKLHSGSATVVTPPVTRYLDDQPQVYQIDYQNNRQMNTKTSYPRIIDRRPMNKPPDNQNWFYRGESNRWTPYEALVQSSIEKAFQLYRSGQGPSMIDIQFPGRSEIYQVNFLKGEQINKNTNTGRDIKRE